MHLIEYKTGYLRSASDIDGQVYEDGRAKYINRPGLIMIFQYNRKPDTYMIHFYTITERNTAEQYLQTTGGEIEMENETVIKLTTTHSVYRFELDENCIPMDDMKKLLWSIYERFAKPGKLREIAYGEMPIDTGHEL